MALKRFPSERIELYTAEGFLLPEECEALIQQCGLNATILRPWYVLGPGHRWPYALIPFYWVMSKLPATRDDAQRLGLVTLDEMVAAIVEAIESPVPGVSIRGVPEIRAAVKLS